MNPELEKLIDFALVNGTLSEKGRQVLYKKAQELNVDIDEFEMILEGKIFLKQKELQTTQFSNTQNTLPPPIPEKEVIKNRNANKCSNCGEPVESFSSHCKACGFEFKSEDDLENFLKLKERLSKVQEEFNNLSWKKKITITPLSLEKEILNSYNIPKTKDALMSFILFSVSKARPKLLQLTTGFGSSLYKTTFNKLLAMDPWIIKLGEALRSANLIFKNDVEFQNKIHEISQEFRLEL